VQGGAAPRARKLAVTAKDGLRLVGEVYGDQGAQSIIFLHGGGQSRSAWRGAARAVADAGYLACAMDLRGHGDSGWSDALAYRFDDYVADLICVIDALGGEPAVLVGASLGGHIAMLAAAGAPKYARALALADVTPWIDEQQGDFMRNTLREPAFGFSNIDDAGAMIARLSGTPMPIGRLNGLRRHLRTGSDGRLYFRWDARLMDNDRLRGGGEGGLFRKAAAKLDLPILVMHAEHSTLTTAEQIAAFRDVQPGLDTAMIKGVGHMVTGDNNDAYVAALLPFLTGSGRRSII